MTNSKLAAPPVGLQQPRVSSVPAYASTTGDEAIEFLKGVGLILDPWEELVLRESLGEDTNGKWSAFEVGVGVPRQNGKGSILEGRQLVGLFLLEEPFQVHSAHQFDTSLEAFRRLLIDIEDCPDLDQLVKRVSRSHGEEGIELKTGCRIRFRTRTKGGGRGFSADVLYLDEAMILPETAHGALLPTLSARPNPQVWYAGSAVDQWVHEHGVVFARIRERGHRGDDPALAYFEWSVDCDDPEKVEEPTNPEMWAMANPGLGIRISAEHIEREQRSMDHRTFAVERLGVGDWPATDGSGAQVIAPEKWAACNDTDSTVLDPVAFAFDVSPDRASASIAVAGERSDGKRHIEVIDRRQGTRWVVERIAELMRAHDASTVACDSVGPAASLIDPLEQIDIEVTAVSAKEYAHACGGFYDDVDDGSLRYLEASELTAAVKGAAKRPLGDAWAWSRKSSSVDISPLVACTLARWASLTQTADPEPFMEVF